MAGLDASRCLAPRRVTRRHGRRGGSSTQLRDRFGSSRCSTSRVITSRDSCSISETGSSSGSRIRAIESALCERLARERKRGGKPSVAPDRRALQVGERLAGLDGRKRTVMKARQLAADVLHEARLVGACPHRAGRAGRSRGARAARPRSAAGSHGAGRRGRRPRPDLEHVGAEELARQESGALGLEPVPRLDPAARDQLQDERVRSRTAGSRAARRARRTAPRAFGRAPCCVPPRRNRARREGAARARPRAPRAGSSAQPRSAELSGEPSSAAPRGRARVVSRPR